MPAVSAVVCTYNRRASLQRTLTSLATQSLADTDYEILVVDNGSTDGTPALLQQAATEIRNLRYVEEPTLGLSRARNTGWHAARGAVVAYLDDDATAEPDWLASIVAAFRAVTPRPGCVAGKISPVWDAPRPAWLGDELVSCLSILDWGDRARPLRPEEWIAGCNMAFPRDVLAGSGGFRTDLGRRGEVLVSMEEGALRREIEARGYATYYDPAVVVRHHIAAARLDRRWFRRRMYWNGVSAARARGPHPWREIVRAARRVAAPHACVDVLFAGDDPARFTRACVWLGRLGYLRGALETSGQ